jgi:hypothetical protein
MKNFKESETKRFLRVYKYKGILISAEFLHFFAKIIHFFISLWVGKGIILHYIVLYICSIISLLVKGNNCFTLNLRYFRTICVDLIATRKNTHITI